MSTAVDVLVLWLRPGSWLVHDLEEMATVERRSARWKHGGRSDASAVQRRLVEAVTSTRRRFAVAVAVVGSVVVVATVADTVDPYGVGLVGYATALGGYFRHAFVHVAQSLVLRGYTPGLVTAVAPVIPASLYRYWRPLSAGLLDVDAVAVTCPVGLVLFAPAVVGTNRLSVRVGRRFD